MINVKVTKKQGNYQNVTVLGHAMYDDYGKDIVCSAVSSIVTTTINGILSLQEEGLTYLVSRKGLRIDIHDQGKTTQTLIHNMIRMLKELELKYPENIDIQ